MRKALLDNENGAAAVATSGQLLAGWPDTCLLISSWLGHAEIAKTLLDRGALATARDNDGRYKKVLLQKRTIDYFCRSNCSRSCFHTLLLFQDIITPGGLRRVREDRRRAAKARRRSTRMGPREEVYTVALRRGGGLRRHRQASDQVGRRRGRRTVWQKPAPLRGAEQRRGLRRGSTASRCLSQ